MPLVQAQEIRLPVPGVMVYLSPPENPPVLKGVTVYPNNPFKFDFILDKGDDSSDLKKESAKLVKYFLASITTPENDLWVNLSPYEKNRIIPQSFGQTDMGRDLLAEDYILKQITASLIYPEEKIGRQFWKRVYEEASKKFGTTNISVNTFNKVWIVPDHAKVYEHGNTAFVVQAKLKVLLEQDYLSMSKHTNRGQDTNINALGSKIVREIVIPELEKEVNEGKNFASLRQVYYSLILAVWFKKRMKDSILGHKYMDQNKVSGIQRQPGTDDIEFIYQRYLKAFKKGVYNYIKEEADPLTQEMIPRKYFSGGWVGAFKAENIDFSQTINPSEIPDSDFAQVAVDLDSAMTVPETIASMATLAAVILGQGLRKLYSGSQDKKVPIGYPGSIVPRILFEMQQSLNTEFKSKIISDNSKFNSFIERGYGAEATIYVDPDPRRDDPKNFYKVFFGKFGPYGMRELKYLKVLNGISGVPKVLDWGRMSKGGVWIHLEGIENAVSIIVRNESGHSMYSEVWKSISPSQRLKALAEVAEILENAHHRRGIGHGDVKPANIIISYNGKEVKVMLIDWGLAREFGKKPFGGTEGFKAPDIIMQNQTDTYALGETILESLKLEGLPATPLKELYVRMKLESPHKRPSLIEVAGKLRKFAQDEKIGDNAQLAAPLSRPDPVVVSRLAQIKSELKRLLISKRSSMRSRYFGSHKWIGGGAVANIYLDPNDPKRFYKVSLHDSGYMDELIILEMLKGIPGVPQIIDWGPRSDGRVWIHMEGIKNSTSIEVDVRNKSFASEVWKKFSFSQRLDKMAKVAEILEAAHQRGISHNDVKPKNIVVNGQGEVMVIDWGIATAIGEKQEASTKIFAAPEIIKQDQSDVYSLGIVLYELFLSKYFQSTPVPPITPTDLINLLKRMILDNINKRPSMKEVADTLRVLAQNAAAENGDSTLLENEDSFRSSDITSDTAMTVKETPDPVVVARLKQIEIELRGELFTRKHRGASYFDSLTRIGAGGASIIFADPNDSKKFYKVILYGIGDEIKELANLEILKDIPGIPRVLDWGTAGDGGIWIHMEGIKNARSITVKDGGRITVSSVWSNFILSQRLDKMAQVAKILDAAHQAGISHNDMKPGNIIINEQGEVMVIDWGLATALGEVQAYGTDWFEAPEAIKQDQSDVYSLIRTMDFLHFWSTLNLKGVETGLKTLRLRMLNENADKRPSMKETADTLRILAQDAAQLAYPVGTLNHVYDVRRIVDQLKDNPIKTAYYPGIGIDFKAAFDITDANIIVGVDKTIRILQAMKSTFGGITNIYAKQEMDLEGRQRVIIEFDYNGKKRKMILYNENINVLTPDKIPELKNGYDFLFLKALPTDSYTHDFFFQSFSLLKKDGLVLENTLERGLERIGGRASDFPILRKKSIGSLIDSYKDVTHGLSIWQKTGGNAQSVEQRKIGPGGIDLTARRMKLDIDSDNATVSQSMDLKALENIEINGLYIKDIEIKPLKNLPEILGISAS